MSYDASLFRDKVRDIPNRNSKSLNAKKIGNKNKNSQKHVLQTLELGLHF